MPSDVDPDVRAVSSTVWWLSLGRLPATTATRMLAPLLGVIAAGLGISVVDAGTILAAFELAGLTAPVAGWFVDRVGPRRAIGASLLAFALAAAAAAGSPGPATFAVSLVSLGLAANVYEAASVVWIAGVTSFATRAAWMGRYELSWAGGLLIGVPVAAVLTLASWRLAFAAIAAVGLLVRVALRSRLAVSGGGGVPPSMGTAPVRRPGADRSVLESDTLGAAHAWAVFGGFGVICGASMLVVVVYGVWLEEEFGLGSVAIGAVAFVLGIADVVANTANLRWTDAMGKTRAAIAGIAVHVLAAGVLVAGAHVFVLGVLGLFVLIAGFEFALLSSKPLLTELGWRRQGLGIGIGIGFAAAAACRSLAAIVGTRLYDWQGMRAAAIASAAVAAVGALAFAVGVHEPSAD